MAKIHAPFTVRDIESAVEQGREAERERIIAMFEEMREQEFAWRERNGQQHLNPDYGIDVARVIWLIKGEGELPPIPPRPAGTEPKPYPEKFGW